LRKDIDNKTSTALSHIINNPINVVNGEGYEVLNQTKYKAKLKEYFSNPSFHQNVNFVRSAAYQNNTIGEWNRYIRTNIFNTGGKGLIIDDLLTGYKTILDEFNSMIIVNGQDYIIYDIFPYKNQFNLNVYCVVLQALDTGKKTETIQIIDSDYEENYGKYINILSALRNRALTTTTRGRWLPFFKFKDKILSMRDVVVDGKVLKKELDYGYCLTVHKLQGSTVGTIFIDGTDICTPISQWGNRYSTEIDLRNRLLYVALSRAEKKAYIKF